MIIFLTATLLYVAVPSLDQGRRNEPILICELHITDGQIVLITDTQNYVTFPILSTPISLLVAVAWRNHVSTLFLTFQSAMHHISTQRCLHSVPPSSRRVDQLYLFSKAM